MAFDPDTATDGLALGEAPVNYATKRNIACAEVHVKQAKAGDLLASELLIKQHNNKIFRTVNRITAHRQDAEVVMQDTFFGHIVVYDNFKEIRASAHG